MANPRSLVAMKIDRVHGQSEKAVEVRAYGKVAWLPKSQLHKEDVRWLQSMIGSEHGEDVQIDVPRWLFDKWKQPADDEPQSAPEKSRTVERRPRSHSDASLPPPPPPYDCGPLPPMAPDFGRSIGSERSNLMTRVCWVRFSGIWSCRALWWFRRTARRAATATRSAPTQRFPVS